MLNDMTPETLILTIGAFALGLILASIAGRFSASRARKRDKRDGRIRELEAELRIARSDHEQVAERLETAEKELEDAQENIQKRDKVISHQQGRVEQLKRDLKESVAKTRQLRNELSSRAEETVRTEVRLKEMETELSVAQASTDLIATGILDYSMAPNDDDDEQAIGFLDPSAPKTGSAKS